MIPRQVFAESVLHFLSPIQPYLEDDSVSEVLINGPDKVYVERKGQLVKTDTRFTSLEALHSALRNIAQFSGKQLGEDRPILEGFLPDGSRIEAVLPPIAQAGPAVAIRRFSKNKLTMQRLVELGALTDSAVQFLAAAVLARQNIVVAGGTGTGKTSLLNALSGLIPRTDRIVVIEDSRELDLQHDHVVSLEARPPDAQDQGGVSVRDLFKATLRLRPDRIVIGEIRGGEALDMIQAMTSGHGGCLSTVHATYPIDALNRLETMALMAKVELPLLALRAQLTSALDLVVQVSRLRDGTRRISHITEVRGLDAQGNPVLSDLFLGRHLADSHYALEPTGHLPRSQALLNELGCELPASMLGAAVNRRSDP